MGLTYEDVIIGPVQSERAFAGIDMNRYVFKVHKDADKEQIRQAIEKAFGVSVVSVNTSKVKTKPKRRGLTVGRKPGYKKAIVKVRAGDSIEIFEGVH